MKTSIQKTIIRLKYIYWEFRLNFVNIIKNRKLKVELDKHSKKVFIFLAADYGNIGDVAITYAQKKYIENLLPDYEVVEVPLKLTRAYLHKIKNKILPNDIVTIVGGGNMTNRYDSIEENRRMVIKKLKNNPIISFPQTIEFTEDIKGQEALKRTQKIYSKHKKLVLIAREPMSYKIMIKLFPNNKVLLTPDIVMSLKENIKVDVKKTNNIGICLRDDKEKILSIDIPKIIEPKYKNFTEKMSTHIGESNFFYEKREKHIFDLLTKIKEKKLFITDRLHGMIFCYITKTPCIVFDNDNHKIKETYEKWLKECNYIKLLDEEEGKNINKYIEYMYNIQIQDTNVRKKFSELDNLLIELRK